MLILNVHVPELWLDRVISTLVGVEAIIPHRGCQKVAFRGVKIYATSVGITPPDPTPRRDIVVFQGYVCIYLFTYLLLLRVDLSKQEGNRHHDFLSFRKLRRFGLRSLYYHLQVFGLVGI